MRATTIARAAAAIACALAASCALLPPRTAQDVVARSVKAHGGDSLTSWQTLTIRGRVELQDGIAYNAAYLLLARPPGKLRVDHDMTADRGRIFNEYFLNDGVAWTRRNLIPRSASVKQLQQWLNQCYGIAYYAKHATALTLKPEAAVAWRWKELGASAYALIDQTPAYVVTAAIGEEAVDLFIDKKTFYLIAEQRKDLTRMFRDFRPFDGVVLATKILEIVPTKQGESLTPFTIEQVSWNGPIENWLFEEDMPQKK